MAGFVGGSAALPVQIYRAVMSASDQGPITGGSYVNVEFDDLPVNSDGGTPLDTATGIFTVPAGMTGFWDIRSQIRIFDLDPDRTYTFTVEKNGGGFDGVIAILIADSTAHSMTAAWRAELAAGDEIKVTLKCAGTYNATMIDGNSAYSWVDYTYFPR